MIGNILYLAFSGRGQAVVQRNGQTGVGLKGTQTVKTASGYLEVGDLFLLGTSGFFDTVAFGVLKAALATGSVNLGFRCDFSWQRGMVNASMRPGLSATSTW